MNGWDEALWQSTRVALKFPEEASFDYDKHELRLIADHFLMSWIFAFELCDMSRLIVLQTARFVFPENQYLKRDANVFAASYSSAGDNVRSRSCEDVG